MLDTGPLGRLARLRPPKEVSDWLQSLLAAKLVVLVPEIADYELRREYLHVGLTDSVLALDQLKIELGYTPITTPVMLRAAELWADARRRGKPTAPPQALDGDVILA